MGLFQQYRHESSGLLDSVLDSSKADIVPLKRKHGCNNISDCILQNALSLHHMRLNVNISLARNRP